MSMGVCPTPGIFKVRARGFCLCISIASESGRKSDFAREDKNGNLDVSPKRPEGHRVVAIKMICPDYAPVE
jgi:hypothetical protein